MALAVSWQPPQLAVPTSVETCGLAAPPSQGRCQTNHPKCESWHFGQLLWSTSPQGLTGKDGGESTEPWQNSECDCVEGEDKAYFKQDTFQLLTRSSTLASS